jgi:SNF2 family DNA or RNA helicase
VITAKNGVQTRLLELTDGATFFIEKFQFRWLDLAPTVEDQEKENKPMTQPVRFGIRAQELPKKTILLPSNVSAEDQLVGAFQKLKVIDEAPFSEKFMKMLEATKELDEVIHSDEVKIEAMQPPELNITLLPHQQIGLQFLKTVESTIKSGLLCDDMGLGKTVQMISLILSNRLPPASKEGETEADSSTTTTTTTTAPCKTTLIVAPVSLLSHWKAEIESKCKSEALKVMIYHSKSKVKAATLMNYDVVITTYGMITLQCQKLPEDPKATPQLKGELGKLEWLRIILDEAHTIKNPKAKVSRVCCALKAHYRWCLSGTPVHNSLEDMFSLLRFLRIENAGDRQWWNDHIGSYFKSKSASMQEKGFVRLHGILKNILLRRTKDMMLNGKPIITLPGCEIKVEKVELSPEERRLYDIVWTDAKNVFKKAGESGKMLMILQKVLRVRQLCDHFYLNMLSDRSTEISFKELNEAINLDPEHILPLSVLDGGSGSACDQCGLSIMTVPYKYKSECSHRFCAECLSPEEEEEGAGKLVFDCFVCEQKMELSAIPKSASRKSFKFVDEEAFRTSTKLATLVSKLKVFALESQDKDPIKTVVFSQFTTFLDLIEIALGKENLEFSRLDGSMSLEARQDNLNRFKTSKTCNVFLCSLKAGGVGLNIPEACRVFLMDPWWCPAVDDQAIDRVNRLGQTRKVEVYRFVISNSMEEKIMALQEEKRKLAGGVLSNDQRKKLSKLSSKDLSRLFM